MVSIVHSRPLLSRPSHATTQQAGATFQCPPLSVCQADEIRRTHAERLALKGAPPVKVEA